MFISLYVFHTSKSTLWTVITAYSMYVILSWPGCLVIKGLAPYFHLEDISAGQQTLGLARGDGAART